MVSTWVIIGADARGVGVVPFRAPGGLLSWESRLGLSGSVMRGRCAGLDERSP